MPQNNLCGVCGLSSPIVGYSKAVDPITLENFSIVCCQSCGSGFTSPIPSNLEPYYPKLYRAYGKLTLGILEFFYSRRVDRWIKEIGTSKSVLEIGCGAGLMLSSFSKKRWQVLGLERNEQVAAHARDSHGINVLSCDISDLRVDEKFDLIVLFNVLEHLMDPVSTLEECKKRLAHGGRIIISVPDFGSWQSLFGRGDWLHLDVPRHITHFTKKGLSAIFSKIGLEIERISCVSYEHDPYGWIETALNKIGSNKNRLTRYLMGFDNFSIEILWVFLLAAILVIPAAAISSLSWLCNKGAIMEIRVGHCQDKLKG